MGGLADPIACRDRRDDVAGPAGYAGTAAVPRHAR